MMAHELALRGEMNLDEVMALGQVLATSGYFKDASQQAQAVVKILAGRELGIGPVAAMTGIYIVQGRVTLSANLMASAIKRSGRYTYRVRRLDDAACEIEFFEAAESIGVSSFTAEDARKAGTQNMNKFPRNMLFARAMSNGTKWFCPDLFAGPIYTPDELGAAVDADGEVIDVPTTNGPRQVVPVTGEVVPANGHKGTTWEESFKQADDRYGLLVIWAQKLGLTVEPIDYAPAWTVQQKYEHLAECGKTLKAEMEAEMEAVWAAAEDLGIARPDLDGLAWEEQVKGMIKLREAVPAATRQRQDLAEVLDEEVPF